MISSLIICKACCGRRPARPANRRAQEGRERLISSTGNSPCRRQYQLSLPFTHHSYLIKCKCCSSELLTLITGITQIKYNCLYHGVKLGLIMSSMLKPKRLCSYMHINNWEFGLTAAQSLCKQADVGEV